MPPTSPHLDRFVAALHRRLLVVTLLEQTGLGVLAGSVVAAVLIPLLIWAGRPALEPTVGAVGVGALIGLLTALKNRPTRLAAAAEADRQLGLADLLSTALSVGARPRESDRDATALPWLQTVTALADAACRSHTPSQVILRRRSARAWTGIALSAALATTVAALVNESPRAGASSDHYATAMGPGETRGPRPIKARPTQAGPNAPRPRAAQHSAESGAAVARGLPPDDAASATPNPADPSRPSPKSNASSSGSNTGTAPGSARAARPLTEPNPPPRAAAGVGSDAPGTTPAGGVGP